MSTLLVNLNDRPDVHAPEQAGVPVPGVGVLSDAALLKNVGSTHFLGDAEHGPWVYFLKKPSGTEIPLHKHRANRIEFVIEGSILWQEPDKEPIAYGAGTLSYVEAGTVYGYTVTDDAQILVIFEDAPGVQFI